MTVTLNISFDTFLRWYEVERCFSAGVVVHWLLKINWNWNENLKWPTLAITGISCIFWGRVTPTCWIICPDVLTCKWIVYNSWDRGALHEQAVQGIDDTFLCQGLSLDLLVNRLHNYIGFSYWQRPASHDNEMGGKAFFFFHTFLHLPQSPRTLWQNHLWGKQT